MFSIFLKLRRHPPGIIVQLATAAAAAAAAIAMAAAAEEDTAAEELSESESESSKPTFHAQNGPSGSDSSCSALVHIPTTPIAEPRPPIWTPSVDHLPCPSSLQEI